MNGRYKGWCTDDFARIPEGPFPHGRMPEDKQAWAASKYGFRSVGDSNTFGSQVVDVHWQQILEGVNERREAIRIKNHHPGYTNEEWNTCWRYATWQDLLAEGGENIGESFIDAIRNLIMNDSHDPADVTYNVNNPLTNPIAAYFGYPYDDDFDGFNWKRFETETELLQWCAVGGVYDGTEQGYTIIPARVACAEYPETYAKRFWELPVPRETYVMSHWEHVWELKKVISMLQYLWPTLGFELDYYTLDSTWNKYEEYTHSNMGLYTSKQLGTHVDSLGYPSYQSASLLTMPKCLFTVKGSSVATTDEPPRVEVHTEVSIEQHIKLPLTGWEFQLDGSNVCGTPAPSNWITSLYQYLTKDAGSNVAYQWYQQNINDGTPFSWGWNALIARLKPNFDYNYEGL